VEKSDYTTTDWENLLKADLNLGRPIIYAGSNTTSGHAWVCDGYQGTNYFHFNWGWGGACNGYYYLTNLNPGGNNYNSNQEAVWNIYPDPAFYPVGCAGQTVLTGYSFGSIEDGSGPSANYTDNQSCSWLIAPDDSVQSISLNFRRMMTEESADIITVYDGSTTSSPVLGTFSGNTLPPSFNLFTTGPCMLVTFSSNASVTGNGFLAQYSSTPVDFCPQNATLTDYDGVISDGSGRFQYRNSSDCNWIIQPPNATSVTLVFDTLNTELMKDFVEVYDYPSMEDLGRFSGYLQPPVITSGPSMLVVFKSDLINRGEGFSATYTTITGNVEITNVRDIKTYPVPAADVLNIEFNMIKQGRAEISIVSVTGSAVYRNDLGSCTGKVSVTADIGNVPAGIYLLKIITDEGTLNRKIVVN
jgi:hypothetical protein